MKFSKNCSKLKNNRFTTIRKNTGYYHFGQRLWIDTLLESFPAEIIHCVFPFRKEDITEQIAQMDADCSKEELIKILETWYGKDFNNFVFLELRRLPTPPKPEEGEKG